MSSLAKFFLLYESPYQHPRLKHWKELLDAEGVTADVEVHQKEDIFGPTGIPRICVTFRYQGGSPPHQEQHDWEEEINQGLIDLGIRASEAENEKLRFSLMLKESFKKVALRYGDGYFNAVLIEYLNHSGFSQMAETQEILRQIHENAAHRGVNYNDCKDKIESVLRTRAQELHVQLKYSQDEAEAILAGAVAKYLDQRYHISSRQRMGLSS